MQRYLENPKVRVALFLGGLLLVVLLVYLLTPVLVPLFFAFLVAYILDPVVDYFEAKRISRSLTIAALALVLILVVVMVPVLVIPSVISEADALIQAAASGGSVAIPVWLDGFLDRLPIEALVRALGWVEPDETVVNAREILAVNVGQFVKANAVELVRGLAPGVRAAGGSAGAAAMHVVTSLGRAGVNTLVFLGNLLLFGFVTAYLLRDFDRLTASAEGLTPPGYRGRIGHFLSKIDLQIRGFLRGQLTVCLMLSVMYMVGLLIVGVPFAVPIGLIGGLANFVPYLGGAATVLVASILVLLQYGADWHILGVLGVIAVSQSIEGTLLTPKIVGEQVGLNPVWVILSIMVFGTWLGFLGLLLAVPIAAVLKVVVEEALVPYKRSALFTGSDGSGDSGS